MGSERDEKAADRDTGFSIYDRGKLFIHRQDKISAYAERQGKVLFYVPSETFWVESDDINL